jgi:hypothetical protein
MLRIYQLKQATVFADSDFVEIHDTASLIYLAASSITLDGPVLSSMVLLWSVLSSRLLTVSQELCKAWTWIYSVIYTNNL